MSNPPPIKPPPTTSFPIAAQPRREIFDAWNSSATGHQRAENRLSGSTSWRDSRTAKLGEQFRAGRGGGKRIADSVGAGSESFERGERTANGGWKRGVVRDRASGQISLWESFGVRREVSPGEADFSIGAEGPAKRRRVERGPVDGDCTLAAVDEGEHSMPPDWQSSQHSAVSQESHMLSPPPEIDDDDKDEQLARDARAEELNSSNDSYDTALLNAACEQSQSDHDDNGPPPSAQVGPRPRSPSHSLKPPVPLSSSAPPPQVFRNLTIYINGSTYPAISDHKLKHLLVTHGANLSISLARRSVTHVILGQTIARSSNSSSSTSSSGGGVGGMLAPSGGRGEGGGGGAGGGLAAGKIQREITRGLAGRGGVGGAGGVKYVSVEWALACIGAGRRVGEREYEIVGTGAVGKAGVHRLFGR